MFIVGAGIGPLISSADGLNPYIFRLKMEETWPMREKMYGKVFISRQSPLFVFIVSMIKVLLPICILTWRGNDYVPAKEEIYLGETKILLFKNIFPLRLSVDSTDCD